jgi:hypothetical protein
MSTHKSALFVLVGVALAVAIALGGCSPAPAMSLAQGSPEEAVETFYRWYVDYPGNALVDGAYRSSEHLTDEFVQEVDEIIASFDKGGYDPFLCAQDIPGDLVVGEAMVSGEMASVLVTEIWNPGTQYESTRDLTVVLRMVNGEWRIADITCSVGGAY